MDISTTYMGLNLCSPLVVGDVAPLTQNIDNIKRMEDARAAAIVLPCLSKKQLLQESLELEHYLTYGAESFYEALSYFPKIEIFDVEASEYLNYIGKIKEMVDIPIIASVSDGVENDYAYQIEKAGADALELNLSYIPTELELSSAQVEQIYIDILQAVKSKVNIPVAIKLSPYFSNIANMAKRLSQKGADGLVLFNHFYQPDINLESLEVSSKLLLSTPQDMHLALRWIGILYGKISANLAANKGIYQATDVVKMLMAGADVTQLGSVLLHHGIEHIKLVEWEMKQWLSQHEYESVRQLQGTMSQLKCAEPDAFEQVQSFFQLFGSMVTAF